MIDLMRSARAVIAARLRTGQAAAQSWVVERLERRHPEIERDDLEYTVREVFERARFGFGGRCGGRP